jgi:indolepyruvate ferredoxin oxidoreductase beta subunit
MKTCDLVLVGVGGQGVLTIGDLLLRAAFEADLPASFCPTKGMAQRGGFVKVEVRLGREGVGPRIGERQADIVVALERSEALNGLRFLKPGGVYVLYDYVWEPTDVQLGVDAYPTYEQAAGAINSGGANLIVLNPSDRPLVQDQPVPANIYVLGAIIGTSPARELLDPSLVERVVLDRWPKAEDVNRSAFWAGLKAAR